MIVQQRIAKVTTRARWRVETTIHSHCQPFGRQANVTSPSAHAGSRCREAGAVVHSTPPLRHGTPPVDQSNGSEPARDEEQGRRLRHRRRREGEIKSAVPKVRAEVHRFLEEDTNIHAEIDRGIRSDYDGTCKGNAAGLGLDEVALTKGIVTSPRWWDG